jgi:hypothetical protein
MAVKMLTVASCVVMPYSVVGGYQRFGETLSFPSSGSDIEEGDEDDIFLTSTNLKA